jgi:hypothetical protein
MNAFEVYLASTQLSCGRTVDYYVHPSSVNQSIVEVQQGITHSTNTLSQIERFSA